MSKILLISDIHFGKDARNAVFNLKGQQVEGVRKNDEANYFDNFIEKIRDSQIDYIVCAGDLTSQGKPLEFKACLEKIYYLAEQICVPFNNVIYCMGNHDVDEKLTDLVFDCEQYDGLKIQYDQLDDIDKDYLKEYYCSISHSWLFHYYTNTQHDAYFSMFNENGPFPMSGYIVKEDVNYFVLNSAFLRTKDQKVKHGILDEKQLRWLEDMLAKKSRDGIWNIVLLHHHPFAYEYPEIYHEIGTLEEGPQLMKICSKYPGTMVIHGHCHWPMALTEKRSEWENPVTFISAGSFSVNSSGRFDNKVENTYHIVELLNYPDEIKLETFAFSRVSGWREIAEDEYNVIGPQRYLGQLPISKEATYELLKQLPKDKVIEFKDLDPKLKYINIKDLNDYLMDIYGRSLSCSFPEAILIHSK